MYIWEPHIALSVMGGWMVRSLDVCMNRECLTSNLGSKL